MRNIKLFEEFNESINQDVKQHATSRQMAAFKDAVSGEVERYKDDLDKVTDGDKSVRLQLMSRVYTDFLEELDRATKDTGNILNAFREQYAKYAHRIRGLNQPGKYPGAFIKIEDVDPVTLSVNVRRHP